MHICDLSTPTGRWETETGQSPGAHRLASLTYSASPSKWKEKKSISEVVLPPAQAHCDRHTPIIAHKYSHTLMYIHKCLAHTRVSYTYIHPIHTSMLKVLYKIPYVHNIAYET